MPGIAVPAEGEGAGAVLLGGVVLGAGKAEGFDGLALDVEFGDEKGALAELAEFVAAAEFADAGEFRETGFIRGDRGRADMIVAGERGLEAGDDDSCRGDGAKEGDGFQGDEVLVNSRGNARGSRRERGVYLDFTGPRLALSA